MKAFKISILLFSISLFTIAKDKPEELIKRKIIVLIEEPNNDLANKMSPADKEQYLQSFTNYNAMLKEVLNANATFVNPSAIEYKTFSEILNIKNKKSKDYLVMYNIGIASRYAPSMGGTMDFPIRFNTITNFEKKSVENKISKDDVSSLMFLDKIEDFNDLIIKNPFFSMNLSKNSNPSKFKILINVNLINFTYNRIKTESTTGKELDFENLRQETCNKNLNKILNSTFVFTKEDFDENFDVSSIKSVFPYKYEVKSLNELSKTDVNSDTNKIYVELSCKYSPSPGLIPGFFEIYNFTGRPIFYNKVKRAGTTFGSDKIKDKFLKKLTEEISDYKEKK